MVNIKPKHYHDNNIPHQSNIFKIPRQQNPNMSEEENSKGNGNGDEKVQFRKKDGVEKDGYICFPVELPPEEEQEEEEKEEREVPVRGQLGTCPDDPR